MSIGLGFARTVALHDCIHDKGENSSSRAFSKRHTFNRHFEGATRSHECLQKH